jgi:division protein CdvB (Snf7/Vps24/ESCRT-III family)
MSILENVRGKISDTAKAAVKVSRELSEISKINNEIRAQEDKVKTLLIEIGEAVYETYIEAIPVNVDVESKCKEITECYNNIEELKAKILEVKNIVICQECKSTIERGFLFCPKCGARVEYEEQQ